MRIHIVMHTLGFLTEIVFQYQKKKSLKHSVDSKKPNHEGSH